MRGRVAKAPPKLPTAVRAADAITTLVMNHVLYLACGRAPTDSLPASRLRWVAHQTPASAYRIGCAAATGSMCAGFANVAGAKVPRSRCQAMQSSGFMLGGSQSGSTSGAPKW